MKYKVSYIKGFEKDYKRCVKRGYNMNLLRNIVEELAKNGSLPETYKPHKLKGEYIGCWECHIKPDWLLVWKQNDKELTLLFMNTGTHSDLF